MLVYVKQGSSHHRHTHTTKKVKALINTEQRKPAFVYTTHSPNTVSPCTVLRDQPIYPRDFPNLLVRVHLFTLFQLPNMCEPKYLNKIRLVKTAHSSEVNFRLMTESCLTEEFPPSSSVYLPLDYGVLAKFNSELHLVIVHFLVNNPTCWT